VAILVVPVALDLALSDRSRPFGYLAADVFYYLTVARNVVEHGSVSFDGVHPTNGFQPLWQAACAGVVAAVRGLALPDSAIFGAVLGLGTALIAASLALLARAATRAGERLGAGFLSLPLGAYALVALPFWAGAGADASASEEGPLPLYGTLWSYVNGMESALALFLLGCVAASFAGDPLRRARTSIGFGLLLGAWTLARLDLGLFAAAAWAVAAATSPARRNAVLAALSFAAVVAAYVAANVAWFGSPLPVSGLLKTTFPRPWWDNLRGLLDLIGSFRDATFPRVVRNLQLVVPAAFAVAFLRSARDWRRSRWDAFLVALSAGTLLLAAHNLLFVPLLHQWHWYYPASTLCAGLIGATFLDRRLAPPRAAAAGALVAAVSLALFASLHRRPGYHREHADFFYEEAPRLRAHYAGREPALLEYDDGIVAFATGFRTMNATGFNLDAEGVRALRTGGLVRLALDRGFDRLTSLVYLRPWVTPRLAAGSPEAIARYAAWFFRKESPLGLSFTVDYWSDARPFAILRVEREGSAAPAAKPAGGRR
jgi:hypothetical protein